MLDDLNSLHNLIEADARRSDKERAAIGETEPIIDSKGNANWPRIEASMVHIKNKLRKWCTILLNANI